jgi:hypothetical protein
VLSRDLMLRSFAALTRSSASRIQQYAGIGLF